MRILIAALLLCAGAAHATGHERLLVLEVEGDEVTLIDRVKLADYVRSGAAWAVEGKNVVVVDRREMAAGVNAAGACRGELPKCAARYGRALSSVYVVIAEARRFGDDGTGVEMDVWVVDAAKNRVLDETTITARTFAEAQKRIELDVRKLVQDALQVRPPRTTKPGKAP